MTDDGVAALSDRVTGLAAGGHSGRTGSPQAGGVADMETHSFMNVMFQVPGSGSSIISFMPVSQ